MDAIENAAYISVGRACGFAGLAIFILCFGLSWNPVLAARTGGVVCLIVAAVLAIYAMRARKRSYKRTELWLMLAESERPPAEVAQQLIGETLRSTYVWFARQAALLSVVLLAAAIMLQAFGV